jgi:hypothetical protein
MSGQPKPAEPEIVVVEREVELARPRQLAPDRLQARASDAVDAGATEWAFVVELVAAA